MVFNKIVHSYLCTVCVRNLKFIDDYWGYALKILLNDDMYFWQTGQVTNSGSSACNADSTAASSKPCAASYSARICCSKIKLWINSYLLSNVKTSPCCQLCM